MSESIKTRLIEEQKIVMKLGDKKRLGIIRLLLAAIKQHEVDHRAECSQEQILAILVKQKKQRLESIKQYDAAGRHDLSEIEQYELAFIDEFLPAQISDDEIRVAVEEVIKQTQATSLKDFGKVMGVLKKS